jgi:hypothetical protein
MAGATTLMFYGGGLAAVTSDSGRRIQAAIDAGNPPSVVADVYGTTDKLVVVVASVETVAAAGLSTTTQANTTPSAFEQLLSDLDTAIAAWPDATPAST